MSTSNFKLPTYKASKNVATNGSASEASKCKPVSSNAVSHPRRPSNSRNVTMEEKGVTKEPVKKRISYQYMRRPSSDTPLHGGNAKITNSHVHHKVAAGSALKEQLQKTISVPNKKFQRIGSANSPHFSPAQSVRSVSSWTKPRLDGKEYAPSVPIKTSAIFRVPEKSTNSSEKFPPGKKSFESVQKSKVVRSATTSGVINDSAVKKIASKPLLGNNSGLRPEGSKNATVNRHTSIKMGVTVKSVPFATKLASYSKPINNLKSSNMAAIQPIVHIKDSNKENVSKSCDLSKPLPKNNSEQEMQPLTQKMENINISESKEKNEEIIDKSVTKENLVVKDSQCNENFEKPACLQDKEEKNETEVSQAKPVQDCPVKDTVKEQDKKSKPSSQSWTLQDFELGKLLGTGKFGNVYVCREKATHIVLALKVLFKKYIEESKILHQVRREVEIQCRLDHPNILKMHGYFHTDRCVCIVLEFAKGGELYKLLHKQPNRCFTEKQSANFAAQLVSGITYCHSKNVIHRDLKPENILISGTGILKIADFGWSVHATKESRRMTLCGTLDYLAPEIVEGTPYDKNVDIWSLGVLIFEFLCGKPSFETTTQTETLKRIRRVDIKFPSHFAADTKDLICRMLRRTPCERLPLESVLEHPWMKRNA